MIIKPALIAVRLSKVHDPPTIRKFFFIENHLKTNAAAELSSHDQSSGRMMPLESHPFVS
jgi:hypothetical protein